jgi:DNA-binding NtrC family response regulator
MEMSAATILVVEDSPSLARTYQSYLSDLDFRVITTGTGTEAREILGAERIDCVLLDLNLPDIDGMEILEGLTKAGHAGSVIVITANASINVAIQAVRNGAFDFLVKPISGDRLKTTVRNAIGHHELQAKVEVLQRKASHTNVAGMVGRSPVMKKVYTTIESAAPSSASVFITGESGTGKELVARAVHDLSPRSDGPFVVVNCGAIPKDLIESELFGHVKGAFTGATSDRAGAAALANGGTLFLDELTEMDIELQSKLLRFIQEGVYQQVGGGKQHSVDIRFVAATNRDPLTAVSEGRLREDLYYRLFVVPIAMPPLRDRGDDILLLAREFLERFSREERKNFREFSPDSISTILAYSWPGNVRQLQNVVRNIVVLNSGASVESSMLPDLGDANSSPVKMMGVDHTGANVTGDGPDKIVPLHVAERKIVEHAIALCDGNIGEAAQRLGVNASTIYRKKQLWEKSEV